MSEPGGAEGVSSSASSTDLLPGSIEQNLAPRVPTGRRDATAGALRDSLAAAAYDSVADVAVCTTEQVEQVEQVEDAARGVHATGTPTRRLLGLIPIERVLAAPAEAHAGDLMDADPPVVTPGEDQERAAWKAVQHGESSLAVDDTDGTFRGLVPPARLLRVLLVEHDQDLARLGGFLASSATARHAMDESLSARLWHRLPWLVLGLLGSAFAAVLVRGFETDLASDVRLAFFIPGMVYMADAVGTQTEALVIRGLSVGVAVGGVFRREAFTGLVVGLVLAAMTLPTVWWVLGSWSLALTVSLSLVAACSVATVVAMSLPWAMSSLGRDPAFGSGPLATVVQDLLSLVIYFAIASVLM